MTYEEQTFIANPHFQLLDKRPRDKFFMKDDFSLGEIISQYQIGRPQIAGYLQIIPLISSEWEEELVPPHQAIVQSKNYGTLHFENPSESTMLIPLHATYVLKAPVQDTAMSRAGLLAPGKSEEFLSACCVQQWQPGLLTAGTYKFGILPFELREPALSTRYAWDFGKLWPYIAQLNERHNLRVAGKINLFLNHFKPRLDQFVAEFEVLHKQVGAIVLLDGVVVGVEIAPSASYFRQIWETLLRDSYGSLVMSYRPDMGSRPSAPTHLIPFNYRVETLAEVRQELDLLEELEGHAVQQIAEGLNTDTLRRVKEQNVRHFQLESVIGQRFIGQAVTRNGKVVYLSAVRRRREIFETLLGISRPLENMVCFVCGYDDWGSPPVLDGIPSYEKCPCCGVHYGFDDLDTAYRDIRLEWLTKGWFWHDTSQMPEDWGKTALREQLQHIEYARSVKMEGYQKWANGSNWHQINWKLVEKVTRNF